MGTQNARLPCRFVANLLSYQVHQNGMQVYLDPPLYINGSSNLFALRWDLHLGLFDQATFVIVPKLGKLVVHFLRHTHQSAQLYHNVQFDHKDKLSHEALYARFAWALMKIVDPPVAKRFTASVVEDSGEEGSGADEGGNGGGDAGGGRSGGGGGKGGHRRGGSGRGGHSGRGRRSGENKGGGRSRPVKRKREDEDKDDESHYGMGATSDPGSDWSSGNLVRSNTCPQEGGA